MSYRIFAVCGSGIGSSLFCRKLIKDSITELGYDVNDFAVSCIGQMEAKTYTARDTDMLISGEAISKSIPDHEGVIKVVVVNLINDKEGMKAAIGPHLEKAAEEGKIKPHN